MKSVMPPSWSARSSMHSPFSTSQLSSPPPSVHVMIRLFKGPHSARFVLGTPKSMGIFWMGSSELDSVSKMFTTEGLSPHGSVSTATRLSPSACRALQVRTRLAQHSREACGAYQADAAHTRLGFQLPQHLPCFHIPNPRRLVH